MSIQAIYGKIRMIWLRSMAHPRVARVWGFVHRHWGKLLIAAILLLPGLAVAIFVLTPDKVEYVTEEVERGELVQIVEAVGEVISEKDLELRFPVSGIVSEVYVDEGDMVTQGQELAALRAEPIRAAVASARANLSTENANLRALEEGARPEDIAIAEAELSRKQALLDAAKKTLQKSESTLDALQVESKTSMRNQTALVKSAISEHASTAYTALRVLEDVFENLDIQHIITVMQPTEHRYIESDQAAAEVALNALDDITSSDSGYVITRKVLDARDAISKVSQIVSRTYNFISAQLPTGSFTFDERETLKTTVGAQKTFATDALSALDTVQKNFETTAANFETKIATEEGTRNKAEADIGSFTADVKIAQAQLDLKRAGTRKADLDAARARVSRAYADLQKAEADLSDTVLKSPIDAHITKVNLKPGEFTPGQFTTTDPAITILGTSPYRVELYASEIDIAKVIIDQKGLVVLDAFPGKEFELKVSEIDPAATIIDGVPKYRIILDFLESYERFKIGMTGDTDIITESRDSVLSIPGRAVIRRKGETIVRVLVAGKKMEEREVEIGLETDTAVEVISGLEEGETVIVLIKE